jgi:site-specific DNA recombinase
MWNKLTSNYTDILIPLLESLKSLRIDEQQEQEISECNNRIMELTEQSHILSSVVAKGYIDSAVFIEIQNTLTLELAAAKKKRSQLLDSNGFDREIARTELLIVLIQSNPSILEDYNENLFLQAVDKIIIHENHIITFRLKNSLELTEYCGKEVDEE